MPIALHRNIVYHILVARAAAERQPQNDKINGGFMMEERTIDQLPIEDAVGMVEWYRQHLIFCIKHRMICFESAYHKSTNDYPAFMRSDYTEIRAEM